MITTYKRISGMVSSSGPTNLVSQLQTIIPNNPTPLDLANLVNSSFLQPTMNYNPLDSDTLHDLFSGITDETRNFETIERSDITNPLSVYNKLKSLNPNKASGPDGICNWVLKEYAELLANPI